MPTADFLYLIEPDDERDPFEVNVEYEYSPYIPAQTYGPAEHCHPAEGGVEGIVSFTLKDGTELDLSLYPGLEQKLLDYAAENLPEDDGPDEDWYRD